MRLVAKFSKEDRVKYISHLDMMRSFQRAFRRASLPVAFTQGFSPHPKMAFASALSVGLTSDGEYLDVIMQKNVEPEEFSIRLNEALPKGLNITQSAMIDTKHPSLMSMIDRASYRIFMPVFVKDFAVLTNAFLNQPYVLVAMEKNDSLKYNDIRPLIHETKPGLNECSVQAVDAMLNSGSKSNLKPQLFAQALLDYFKLNNDCGNCKIHRLDMFLMKDGIPVTPLDLAEVI